MFKDLENLYEIKMSNEITSNIHCPMGMKSLGRGESAIALSIISQLQSLFFGQKN
jgi:xanthine/CO dehydrogenase XdhC/CoxF family maturation factor